MSNWDKRYRESPERLFGAAPIQYLRQVMARSDVAPERALMLGDDDGRNGTWLAGQGVQVTAVDISAVATEQAMAHDRAAGVRVERIVADLADWSAPAGAVFDAVFMLYLQCEARVRLDSLARGAAALAPGGLFVAEGFSRTGASTDGLGPKDPDHLYDLASLSDALAGFRLLEAFDGVTWLDEGARHQGEARVVRLLARKPAP